MAEHTETIQAATIARYTDKSGKLLGFGVKSNHGDETYCVRFHKRNGKPYATCTCESAQYSFHNCSSHPVYGKICSHIRAVLEVSAARTELKKQQAQVALNLANFFADLPILVAQIEEQEMKRAAFDAVCAEVRAIEARYAAERQANVSQVSEERQAVLEVERHLAEDRKKKATLGRQERKSEERDGRFVPLK